MAKSRTIYKIVSSKGIVAGIAETRSDAIWISSQFPKQKMRIVKTTTIKSYGKTAFKYKGRKPR